MQACPGEEQHRRYEEEPERDHEGHLLVAHVAPRFSVPSFRYVHCAIDVMKEEP